jgi:hypothetical protein
LNALRKIWAIDSDAFSVNPIRGYSGGKHLWCGVCRCSGVRVSLALGAKTVMPSSDSIFALMQPGSWSSVPAPTSGTMACSGWPRAERTSIAPRPATCAVHASKPMVRAAIRGNFHIRMNRIVRILSTSKRSVLTMIGSPKAQHCFRENLSFPLGIPTCQNAGLFIEKTTKLHILIRDRPTSR